MSRVLVVAILVCAGCGPARRGEPLAPPIALHGEALRGEALFFQSCHPCHPFGEGGLGPSLNDKALPGLAIRAQVRGGLGDMPDFDDELLPDSDLDAIVAYLEALRRGSGG